MIKPYDQNLIFARIRIAERILNLQTEINTLADLLPICIYCKNIRDDNNYWQRVESYLKERIDIEFSHSVCPDCYEKKVKPQLKELNDKK
jgi:hypothetical protein